MKLLHVRKIDNAYEKIEGIFRAACHHPKCDDIFSCPQTHELCKSKLDMRTSVFWELALVTQSLSRRAANSCYMGQYEIDEIYDNQQIEHSAIVRTLTRTLQRHKILKKDKLAYRAHNALYYLDAMCMWAPRINEDYKLTANHMKLLNYIINKL